jgi:His/Glu/Gln/Arg/opine family amino acid ABC transporter permease subunit
MRTFILPICNAMPLLGYGMFVTLYVWIIAGFVSLVMGSIMGVLRAQKLQQPYITSMLNYVTALLRGVPFYVQLLIAYFVIPELLGVATISPFWVSTIALGLCSAAYVSQIIKSGLDAIPSGEWEAAYILGYAQFQALVYLMAPRALRLILPALRGELDQLLKSTSIISTIGIFELTNAARNIVERDLQPLPIYCAVAVMYLLMSVVFNVIVTRLFEGGAYD